jgi:hypothetical protein
MWHHLGTPLMYGCMAVWLKNLAGTSFSTSFATTSGSGSGTGTLTPNTGSRRPSYDTIEDASDLHSVGESSTPTPGAVRVPGLHRNASEASNDLTTTLPSAVDPFHHVVAQDDDNSINEDLRRRVTNLEQDLRRS